MEMDDAEAVTKLGEANKRAQRRLFVPCKDSIGEVYPLVYGDGVMS